MKKAIRVAIMGGYIRASQLEDTDWHNIFLLDRFFWKAIGKALGKDAGWWKAQAMEFVSLKFSEFFDEDAFWKELLK